MSRLCIAVSVWLPLVLLAAEPSMAQPDSPDSDPNPSVTLLDTVRPLPADPVTVLQNGDPDWSRVAEDDTQHDFLGDTVIRNDRLAVVIRRGGDRAELYARVPQVMPGGLCCIRVGFQRVLT